MPYVYLTISIITEVCGVTMLKLSSGFTVLGPTVLTIVAYAISFSFLILTLKHLPLGLVYGIWGGLGTALTTVIGIMFWGDPFGLFTGLGVALVVTGVFLLNKGQQEIDEKREKEAAAPMQKA